MKISLILCLGFVTALVSPSLADPCHTSELMKCHSMTIEWLDTLPKKQTPLNDEQLKYACELFTEAAECAFKYRDRCLTPLQKDFLRIAIEGPMQLKDDVCNPASDFMAGYKRNSPCVNEYFATAEATKKVEYLLMVVSTFTQRKPQEYITYLCCGYGKIKKDILGDIDGKCGVEAKEMTVTLVHQVLLNLPDFFCGGYDGTHKMCQNLLPADDAVIPENVKETEIHKYFHSILQHWLD